MNLFPPSDMKMTGGEKKDINIFKHIYKQVRAHVETHSADIARPPCLASQPEIVDTFAKSEARTLHQGIVGRFFGC